MQLKINFNVSIRCNKCGARLDAAEEIPSYNYDSIIVVDPHVCGVLTQRAADLPKAAAKCDCGATDGYHNKGCALLTPANR
jgi:hypothetical protein